MSEHHPVTVLRLLTIMQAMLILGKTPEKASGLINQVERTIVSLSSEIASQIGEKAPVIPQKFTQNPGEPHQA